MSRAGRAFTESFVLHGLLAGALLVLGGMLTPTPDTIRLDFSLQAPALAPEAQVPAAPQPPTKAAAAVQQAPLARLAVPKPRPRPPVPPRAPAPTAPSLPDPHPAATAMAPETAVAPADPASAPSNPAAAASGTGPSPANAGEAYRRAHFIAIRDAILAHLRYPMIARRQGWSGQVEVAFLIAPDGSVSELRIRTSSGHEVLDQQALAAIRRAAPFSPPHVTALLVMPVAFQLN